MAERDVVAMTPQTCVLETCDRISVGLSTVILYFLRLSSFVPGNVLGHYFDYTITVSFQTLSSSSFIHYHEFNSMLSDILTAS